MHWTSVVDRPESEANQILTEHLMSGTKTSSGSIDHAPAGKIVFLTLPMKAISASQIPAPIAGECNKGLLDPRVWSYINGISCTKPRR